MSARVQARSGDASDATVAVLHEQLQQNLEPVDWERVDASGNLDEVRRRVQPALFPQNAAVR
jgi:predicted kinase